MRSRGTNFAPWAIEIIRWSSIFHGAGEYSSLLPLNNCGGTSDAKQKKHVVFFNKKPFFFFKPSSKKKFFRFFYYYFQFKGRKVFFNTLECLFMLYTSCKTLHSVCQLHFH